MPSSPKKRSKSTTKSTRGAKSKGKTTDASATPSKALLDASNALNRPPPTTPRLIDFKLDQASEDGDKGGWSSSDDSFEEKVTWSRHRTRVIPGGCTPRNIQEVRRRLHLEDLPEDQSPSTNLKVIPISKGKPVRPSTPVKQFKAKDPSMLPPTPSPKKAADADTTTLSHVKPLGQPENDAPKSVLPHVSLDMPNKIATLAASPRRITRVKEFNFATDTRSRRSSPAKARGRNSTDSNVMEDGQDMATLRDRLREMGTTSILAWGETRGRYVDN